jgi:hypothetical protein
MVLRCKAAVRENFFFTNAKRRSGHPGSAGICLHLSFAAPCRQDACAPSTPNNFLVILVLHFSRIRYCAIICHKLLNTSSEVK